jgi:Flp pilus assembly protein TadB
MGTDQKKIKMKFNQTNLFIITFLIAFIFYLRWLAWHWFHIGLIVTGLVMVLFIWRWLQEQVKVESYSRFLQKQMMDAYGLIKVLILQGQMPYQAIQTTLPFLDSNLAEAFQDLLMDIDLDKSIQPYLHFAKKFQSLMIEQLLFSLYQLENQGGDGRQLQQFQYLFDQVEQQFYQQELLQFHEKMQQQNNLVMLATALIAMTLLVGVMQMIGGMLYGI